MTDALHDELRGAGLRVTAGRVAVLGAIDALPHSSAETLHASLGGIPTLSIQSVHNVLADLTAVALIRRIEPARSAARYERRVDDNHHHLVCTTCGSITDVDCVVGQAPCLHPSNAEGFDVTMAEITFWGVCTACQTSSPSA